ncbi:MAG: formate dehydrogenase subunit alpha [Gammaproteobacteria bacterium]|nr:formate dehydrogenase subunit alpha [Gammaproteobacteria bacterium]
MMSDKLAFLNGVAHPYEASESILAFSRRLQTSIPTLCDDPRLDAFGSCRVCSVDVALSADGPRKVMASCHTPVSEGMHIYTHSERIDKLRHNIVELVLSDYPDNCEEYDTNLNSELQDVAVETGVQKVRFKKGKQSVANLPQSSFDSSHPYMRMDLSKCINCYRCVRACDEIQGEQVLGVQGRGFDSRIIIGLEQSFVESDCVSCGACAQTCPTGAISDVFRENLTDKAEIVRTVCSYCGVGCNLDVSVENNSILSISAPNDAEVNAGHTCLKGRYAWRFYDHPERLSTPLIRIDGTLQPVSWAKAFAYLADNLQEIKDTYGSNAIAGISSSRCSNEENYLLQKMMRVVLGTNNIDCCARVCHSPTAFGMQKAFGTGAATNSIKDLDVTEFVMIIGANPTAAHPVTGVKIKQKAMKGTPLLVIDPVKTELTRFATWHIQLRPGTNVAVLNMMAYYIISSGLVDEDFVASRTESYQDYKQEILSLNIDKLSKISGVDKALVKAAAIAYAKAKAAMSFHGLGVTEHSQGSKAIMSIADLVMLTGNIGRPGVGMNPLRGQNNVQGAADMGCQPHQGAGYFDVNNQQNNQYYKQRYNADIPFEVGYKIPEMFDAAISGELKAMWIMGEDVAQTDPNQKHVLDGLNNLKLLVVQEIFMSETAKLADVVLPGTSFLEKSGTFTNGERRVQRINAAVNPKSGCKTDGQIVVEMMRALGYEQADYDAETMLREISTVVPFFSGITWENLGNNGLQWPVTEDGIDTKILHTESFKRSFGKFHYFDFKESSEISTHANDYPYILTTSRNLEHYNSGTMTRRTDNSKIVNKDILLVNAEDARNKQVLTGDNVRLFSDRGEVELGVLVSEKVLPGILFTTFHFPEIMINRVTGDVHDEDTKCPEYKVVAVDFEKLK